MAAPKTKPTGRPKGSKNKITVLKEEAEKKLLAQHGALILTRTQEVLETVVERAIAGDMTAAKMILDRAIPVQRAIDSTALKGAVSININIVGDEHGEHSASSTANTFDQSGQSYRQEANGKESSQIVPVLGSPEGQRTQ